MRVANSACGVAVAALLACTPGSEPVGGTGGAQEGGTSTGSNEKGPTTGDAVSSATVPTVTGEGASGTTPGGLDLGGGADDSTGSSGGESDEGSGSAGQNCGDGEIDPETLELCDHDLDEFSSDEMPKWVECRDCVPAGDILFVLAQPAALGPAGIEGADEQCRAEAADFSLMRSDECVALLLDESVEPEARFAPFLTSDDPLVRPNGEIIASSLQALAEAAPAGKDLRGLKEPLGDSNPWVWTGFRFDDKGFQVGANCVGWSSNNDADKGVLGQFRLGGKDAEWTAGKMFDDGRGVGAGRSVVPRRGRVSGGGDRVGAGRGGDDVFGGRSADSGAADARPGAHGMGADGERGGVERGVLSRPRSEGTAAILTDV
jgi:hypothetical protein